MNTGDCRAKRARAPKEKEARRNHILHVASQLFSADAPQLPTADKIAKTAGIAKGTVYLYFKSKEEIFLCLLEQHQTKWLERVRSHLEQNPGLSIEIVVESLCSYIEQEPQFFHLASMSGTVIEQNIDKADLIAYKSHCLTRFKKLGEFLQQHLSQIAEERTADEWVTYLVRSYAILLGIWQQSNPHPSIRAVLLQPSLSILMPDFSHEARDALRHLWQSALEEKEKKKTTLWSLKSLLS
ncbi:TetR family transcriptional regulator [Algicola sagamiensis]|uniref:TetR family transcriptional regulator n=1 Tax=Algicola sagamiensis TaxID=163869 RepID=UPI000375B166|nr:TetR family transcriptional regulator [Algicola sagamiensis]